MDGFIFPGATGVPGCNNENQSRFGPGLYWHIYRMRRLIITGALALVAPLLASADETRVYTWTDEEGNLYYGDSVPPEYAERPKTVLNDQGVAVENLEGKKTAEQIEADRIENERRMKLELQRRADHALLATYLSVEEIEMHRDRRIELAQAQSRVTELYLRNLNQRLQKLRAEARQYKPYADNADAPMIPDDLAEDLSDTRKTIERHERNLEKYKNDQQQIISRFDGDIVRFKMLKGIE